MTGSQIREYVIKIRADVADALADINKLQGEFKTIKIENTVDKAFQKQLENVTGAIGKITQELKGLKQDFKDIDLKSFTGDIKSSFDDLKVSIDTIKDSAKSLQEAFDFSGKSNNGLTSFVNTINQQINDLVNNYSDAVQKIQDMTANGFIPNTSKHQNSGMAAIVDQQATDASKSVGKVKDTAKKIREAGKELREAINDFANNRENIRQAVFHTGDTISDTDIENIEKYLHIMSRLQTALNNANRYKTQSSTISSMIDDLYGNKDYSIIKGNKKHKGTIQDYIDTLQGKSSQLSLQEQITRPVTVQFQVNYEILSSDDSKDQDQLIQRIVDEIKEKVQSKVQKKMMDNPIRIPISFGSYELMKDEFDKAEKRLDKQLKTHTGEKHEQALIKELQLKITPIIQDNIINDINSKIEEINKSIAVSIDVPINPIVPSDKIIGETVAKTEESVQSKIKDLGSSNGIPVNISNLVSNGVSSVNDERVANILSDIKSIVAEISNKMDHIPPGGGYPHSGGPFIPTHPPVNNGNPPVRNPNITPFRNRVAQTQGKPIQQGQISSQNKNVENVNINGNNVNVESQKGTTIVQQGQTSIPPQGNYTWKKNGRNDDYIGSISRNVGGGRGIRREMSGIYNANLQNTADRFVQKTLKDGLDELIKDIKKSDVTQEAIKNTVYYTKGYGRDNAFAFYGAPGERLDDYQGKKGYRSKVLEAFNLGKDRIDAQLEELDIKFAEAIRSSELVDSGVDGEKVSKWIKILIDEDRRQESFNIDTKGASFRKKLEELVKNDPNFFIRKRNELSGRVGRRIGVIDAEYSPLNSMLRTNLFNNEVLAEQMDSVLQLLNGSKTKNEFSSGFKKLTSVAKEFVEQNEYLSDLLSLSDESYLQLKDSASSRLQTELYTLQNENWSKRHITYKNDIARHDQLQKEKVDLQQRYNLLTTSGSNADILAEAIRADHEEKRFMLATYTGVLTSEFQKQLNDIQKRMAESIKEKTARDAVKEVFGDKALKGPKKYGISKIDVIDNEVIRQLEAVGLIVDEETGNTVSLREDGSKSLPLYDKSFGMEDMLQRVQAIGKLAQAKLDQQTELTRILSSNEESYKEYMKRYESAIKEGGSQEDRDYVKNHFKEIADLARGETRGLRDYVTKDFNTTWGFEEKKIQDSIIGLLDDVQNNNITAQDVYNAASRQINAINESRKAERAIISHFLDEEKKVIDHDSTRYMTQNTYYKYKKEAQDIEKELVPLRNKQRLTPVGSDKWSLTPTELDRFNALEARLDELKNKMFSFETGNGMRDIYGRLIHPDGYDVVGRSSYARAKSVRLGQAFDLFSVNPTIARKYLQTPLTKDISKGYYDASGNPVFDKLGNQLLEPVNTNSQQLTEYIKNLNSFIKIANSELSKLPQTPEEFRRIAIERLNKDVAGLQQYQKSIQDKIQENLAFNEENATEISAGRMLPKTTDGLQRKLDQVVESIQLLTDDGGAERTARVLREEIQSLQNQINARNIDNETVKSSIKSGVKRRQSTYELETRKRYLENQLDDVLNGRGNQYTTKVQDDYAELEQLREQETQLILQLQRKTKIDDEIADRINELLDADKELRDAESSLANIGDYRLRRDPNTAYTIQQKSDYTKWKYIEGQNGKKSDKIVQDGTGTRFVRMPITKQKESDTIDDMAEQIARSIFGDKYLPNRSRTIMPGWDAKSLEQVDQIYEDAFEDYQIAKDVRRAAAERLAEVLSKTKALSIYESLKETTADEFGQKIGANPAAEVFRKLFENRERQEYLLGDIAYQRRKDEEYGRSGNYRETRIQTYTRAAEIEISDLRSAIQDAQIRVGKMTQMRSLLTPYRRKNETGEYIEESPRSDIQRRNDSIAYNKALEEQERKRKEEEIQKQGIEKRQKEAKQFFDTMERVSKITDVITTAQTFASYPKEQQIGIIQSIHAEKAKEVQQAIGENLPIIVDSYNNILHNYMDAVNVWKEARKKVVTAREQYEQAQKDAIVLSAEEQIQKVLSQDKKYKAAMSMINTYSTGSISKDEYRAAENYINNARQQAKNLLMDDSTILELASNLKQLYEQNSNISEITKIATQLSNEINQMQQFSGKKYLFEDEEYINGQDPGEFAKQYTALTIASNELKSAREELVLAEKELAMKKNSFDVITEQRARNEKNQDQELSRYSQAQWAVNGRPRLLQQEYEKRLALVENGASVQALLEFDRVDLEQQQKDINYLGRQIEKYTYSRTDLEQRLEEQSQRKEEAKERAKQEAADLSAARVLNIERFEGSKEYTGAKQTLAETKAARLDEKQIALEESFFDERFAMMSNEQAIIAKKIERLISLQERTPRQEKYLETLRANATKLGLQFGKDGHVLRLISEEEFKSNPEKYKETIPRMTKDELIAAGLIRSKNGKFVVTQENAEQVLNRTTQYYGEDVDYGVSDKYLSNAEQAMTINEQIAKDAEEYERELAQERQQTISVQQKSATAASAAIQQQDESNRNLAESAQQAAEAVNTQARMLKAAAPKTPPSGQFITFNGKQYPVLPSDQIQANGAAIKEVASLKGIMKAKPGKRRDSQAIKNVKQMLNSYIATGDKEILEAIEPSFRGAKKGGTKGVNQNLKVELKEGIRAFLKTELGGNPIIPYLAGNEEAQRSLENSAVQAGETTSAEMNNIEHKAQEATTAVIDLANALKSIGAIYASSGKEGLLSALSSLTVKNMEAIASENNIIGTNGKLPSNIKKADLANLIAGRIPELQVEKGNEFKQLVSGLNLSTGDLKDQIKPKYMELFGQVRDLQISPSAALTQFENYYNALKESVAQAQAAESKKQEAIEQTNEGLREQIKLEVKASQSASRPKKYQDVDITTLSDADIRKQLGIAKRSKSDEWASYRQELVDEQNRRNERYIPQDIRQLSSSQLIAEYEKINGIIESISARMGDMNYETMMYKQNLTSALMDVETKLSEDYGLIQTGGGFFDVAWKPNESLIPSDDIVTLYRGVGKHRDECGVTSEKRGRDYDDFIAYGMDRINKLKLIRESGTMGDNSTYDLLRLNHPAWDKVKESGFFSDVPESGLQRYQKILNVVEQIVQEMIKAKGVTEDEVVSQLAQIQNAKGGSFRLNGHDAGWTHFATYTNGQKDQMPSRQSGELNYKVYAAFENFQDLNQEVVSQIMKELSSAGFKGRLKTTTGSTSFGDKINGLAITDQLVVHGQSKIDQEIAYNVLRNLFGSKLSYLGGGIDTPEGSFSETLAKGDISKYLPQTSSVVSTSTVSSEQASQQISSEMQQIQDSAENAAAAIAKVKEEASTPPPSGNAIIDYFSKYYPDYSEDQKKAEYEKLTTNAIASLNSGNRPGFKFSGSDQQLEYIQALNTELEKLGYQMKKVGSGENVYMRWARIGEAHPDTSSVDLQAATAAQAEADAKKAAAQASQEKAIAEKADAQSTVASTQANEVAANQAKPTTKTTSSQVSPTPQANTQKPLPQSATTAIAALPGASGESGAFNGLINTLTQDIPNAIQTKNNAFQNEASLVQSLATQEAEAFNSLISQLEKIAGLATNFKFQFSITGADQFNEEFLSNFDKLKTAVDGIDVSKFTALGQAFGGIGSSITGKKDISKYFTELATAINSFSQSMGQISINNNFRDLSDMIERISNAGSALRDAAAVFKNQSKVGYDYKYGIDKQSEQEAKDFLSEAKYLSNARNITNATKYRKAVDAYNAGDKTQGITAEQFVWLEEYENRLRAFGEAYKALMSEIESSNGQFISRLTPDGIKAIDDAWMNLAQTGVRVGEGFKMESDKIIDYSEKLKVEQEKINLIPQQEQNEYGRQISMLQSQFNQEAQLLEQNDINWGQFVQRMKAHWKEYNEYKKANPFGSVNILNGASGSTEDVRQQIQSVLAQRYKVVTQNVSGGTIDSSGLGHFSAQVVDAQNNVQNLNIIWDRLNQSVSATMSTAADQFKGRFLGLISELQAKSKQLFVYWTATFMNPYRLIGTFKQVINIVKQYDDAFTEMRKVSDESVSTLREFQKASFDIASSLGTTGLQIQKSTADWLRLGETMDEAKKSAEVSNLLLNVSEFQNIDNATQALVSASQAYDDLEKIDIVDKLNNIGNNFSISTDQLAEGLQNAAAVLKTSGNDIDQALAILTAGNAITQDIGKTAAGVRTISLRIAGTKEAKEQLEELGEDTSDFVVQTESKVDAQVRKYTRTASNPNGVSVLDSNGRLRDTYDILLDIAKIYDEIVAKDDQMGTNTSNALLELLAGKTRSNILASILQNPEMLEDVYKSSQDSSGSAMEENEKYLDSISGKLQQTTNELHRLANIVIDSEGLKILLDIATELLKVINQLVSAFGGLNGIIGTIVGITMTRKGLGVGSGVWANGLLNLFGGKKGVEAAAKSVYETYSKEISSLGLKAGAEDLLAPQLQAKGMSLTDIRNSNIWGPAVKGMNDAEIQALRTSDAFEKLNAETAQAPANAGIMASGFSKVTSVIGGVVKASVTILAVTAAIALATKAIGWFVKNVVYHDKTIIENGKKATESIESRYEAYEKLRNSLEELGKSTSGKDNDLTTSESISEISEKYAELHKGVNALNNENRSLSTDKYQEYLDLCKQLAEQSPELIKGYDSQGNAILNLGNTASETEAALIRMYEAQKLAANVDIAGKIQDSYEGFSTLITEKTEENGDLGIDIEGYKNQLQNTEKQAEIINNTITQVENNRKQAQQAIADQENNPPMYGPFLPPQRAMQAVADGEMTFDEAFPWLEGTKSENELKQYQEELIDGWVKFDVDNGRITIPQYVEGLDESLKQIFEDFGGRKIDQVGDLIPGFEAQFNVDDLESLTPSDINSLQGQIADYVKVIFDAQIAALRAKIDSNENQKTANDLFIRDQTKSIQGIITKYLTTSDTFGEQSDSIQDAILNNLGSLDFSVISDKYNGQIVPYIYGELIAPLDNLTPDIQKKISELFEVKPDGKSAQEYVDQMVNIINNTFGEQEDRNRWYQLFGVENIQDEIDTLTRNIYTSFSGKKHLTSEQIGELNGLSLEDLRIYFQLIQEGFKGNWEELEVEVEKYKENKAAAPTDTLADVLNDESYKESADTFASNLSTLTGALETLRTEGHLTAEEMRDLQEAFPDLTEFTTEAIQAKAFEELDKQIDLIRDKMAGMSPEGVEQARTYIRNMIDSYGDLGLDVSDVRKAYVDSGKDRQQIEWFDSQVEDLRSKLAEEGIELDTHVLYTLVAQDEFSGTADQILEKYKDEKFFWEIILENQEFEKDITKQQALANNYQAMREVKQAKGETVTSADYGDLSALDQIANDRRGEAENAWKFYVNASEEDKDAAYVAWIDAETAARQAEAESLSKYQESVEAGANDELKNLNDNNNVITDLQNDIQKAELNGGKASRKMYEDLAKAQENSAIINNNLADDFQGFADSERKKGKNANQALITTWEQQAAEYRAAAIQAEADARENYANPALEEYNQLQNESNEIQRDITKAEQKNQKVTKQTYRDLLANGQKQIRNLRQQQEAVDDFGEEWWDLQNDIESMQDSMFEWGQSLDRIVYDQAAALADAINTAISESASDTGLTTETINALITGFSDLSGKQFDLSDMFYNTADGVKVNTEAMRELTDAEFDLISANLAEEIQAVQDKMKGTKDQTIWNSYNEQLQTLMQTQAQYFAQYEEMQKALSYNNAIEIAEGTADKGENYDNNYARLKTFKEDYENGKVGTDQFKAFTAYGDMFGRNTYEAFEDILPKFERYFTEDATEGVENFLKDLQAKGLAEYSDAEGWNMLFENEEDAARAMGMGPEFFNDMLGKIQDLGGYYAKVGSLTEYELNKQDLNAQLESALQTYVKMQQSGQATTDELKAQEKVIQSIRDQLNDNETNRENYLKDQEEKRKADFEGIQDNLKMYQDLYDKATSDEERDAIRKMAQKEVAQYGYDLKEGEIALSEKAQEDYESRFKQGTIETPLTAKEMGVAKEDRKEYKSIVGDIQNQWGKNQDLSNLIQNIRGMSADELKEIDHADGEWQKGEESLESICNILGVSYENADLLIDALAGLGLIEFPGVLDEIPDELAAGKEQLESLLSTAEKGSGAKYQIELEPDYSQMTPDQLRTQLSEIETFRMQLSPDDTEMNAYLDELEENARVQLDIQAKLGAGDFTLPEIKRLIDTGDDEGLAAKLGIDMTQEGATDQLERYKKMLQNMPQSYDMVVHIDDSQFQQLVATVTGEPLDAEITANTDEAEGIWGKFKKAVEGNPIVQTITQFFTGNKETQKTQQTQATTTTATATVGANTSSGNKDVEKFEKNVENVNKTTGTATVQVNTDQANAKINALRNNLLLLNQLVVAPQFNESAIVRAITRTDTLIQKLQRAQQLKQSSAIGTAHARGTALSNSYAGGTQDWTVGEDESALVNEIGQESIVRDGVWQLIPGGPHVEDLQRDDIIFNAEQTADLIRTGKTARSGRLVAHANGTVDNMSAFASLGKYKSKKKKSSGGGKNNGGGGGGGNNKSNGGKGKKASKALDRFNKWLGKLFDWIEVRLDRIQRRIDLDTAKAENAIGNIGKNLQEVAGTISDNKNAYINDAMKQIANSASDVNSIQIQRAANGKVTGYSGVNANNYNTMLGDSARGALRYQQQADKVAAKALSTGLFKTKKRNTTAKQQSYINGIVSRIQDGTIDISEYNEKTRAFIDAYKQWYDKSQDLVQSSEELKQQYKELQQTKLDNITDEFEAIVGYQEAITDSSKAMVEYYKSFGQNVNTGDRKELLGQRDRQQKITNDLALEFDKYTEELKNAKEVFGENSNEYHEALTTWEGIRKEWIESRKATVELTHEIDELAFTVRGYAIDRLKTLGDKLASIASLAEKRGTDTRGHRVVENYYSDQLGTNYQMILKYQEEINERKAQMEKYIKDEQEGLRVDSALYQELSGKINDAETQILSLLSANEDLVKSIRGLRWKGYEDLQRQLNNAREDFQHIRDLIRDGEILDDDGQLTERGFASIALIGEDMLIAEKNISNAKAALQKLDEEYKNGVINLETYNSEVDEQIGLIQDNAKAIQDDQQALADIKIDQITAQNDALQDLIKARQDALSAKKEYYDWDKTLKNKNKDIAQLQAQINALNGVTNDAAKARRAQLEAELSEKQEDLNDTLYEHSIELQQEGYDKLSEDMQEALDNAVKLINGDQKELLKTSNAMLAQLKTNNVDEKEVIEGIIEDRGTAIHDRQYPDDSIQYSNETQKFLEDTLGNGSLPNQLGVNTSNPYGDDGKTVGQNISDIAPADAITSIKTDLQSYLTNVDGEFVGIGGKLDDIEEDINKYYDKDKRNAVLEELEQLAKDYDDADKVKAKEVSDAISALTDKDSATLADKDAIAEALANYNSLTENQKGYVDKEDTDKLTGLSDKMTQLEEEAAKANSVPESQPEEESTLEDLAKQNDINTLAKDPVMAAIQTGVQRSTTVTSAEKKNHVPLWTYLVQKTGYAPTAATYKALAKALNVSVKNANKITKAEKAKILKKLKKHVFPAVQQISAASSFAELKSGAKKIDEDMLAWTNEEWDKNGSEMIVRAKDNAILTPLKANDTVIPADLAKNLFKWGAISPDKFIINPFVGKWSADGGSTTNTDADYSSAAQMIEMHFDSLFHIDGNVDESVMPRLENLGKSLVNDRDFQKNVIKFVTKDFVRESKKQGIR